MGRIVKIVFFCLIGFSNLAQKKDEIKKNKNIDSLNIDCFSQLIINKQDTIKKYHCIERNATIFIENKSYIYLGTILNPKSDTLSSTKIYFTGTNKRFSYSPSNQMVLNIEFERFKNDSLLLDSIFENSKCCIWVKKIESGVVENVEKCWIKAIRNNQFRITETAGFPDVQYPLEINKQWTREVAIGDGWGDWGNKTSKSIYTVKSKKNYQLKTNILDCWEIEVKTDFNGKQNKHIYLFNENFGFVLMKYEFHDGIKINFEMLDAINKN